MAEKSKQDPQKKRLHLEADVPSYDRGKPLFRYNGVLETISSRLHSFLPLAIWTMVETK